jgi:hypothetical protein
MFMARLGRFRRRVLLTAEGERRMWVFAVAGLGLPVGHFDVVPLNRPYDRRHCWPVSIRSRRFVSV